MQCTNTYACGGEINSIVVTMETSIINIIVVIIIRIIFQTVTFTAVR